MRPNPTESIRGIVATLATGILPELTTPWAQAQLRYSMGLLDSIAAEWDSAADRLVRENEALQRVCGIVAESAIMLDRNLLAEQIASIRHAAALPQPADLRISTLAEFNNALWLVLEPIIAAVGAADASTDWATLVKRELQPVLRGYVADRQYRTPG